MVNSLANGDGRADNMVDAANRARTSEFNSTQQLVNPSYHRSSALETNQMMVVNGMTAENTQNQLYGIKNVGQSETTASAEMYLRNPTSPGLYRANLV